MKYTVCYTAEIVEILDEEGLKDLTRKKDGMLSPKKIAAHLDVDHVVISEEKIFASDK